MSAGATGALADLLGPTGVLAALRLPGTASLVFLAYVTGFLPWVAIRSARRLRDAQAAGAELPPRQAIWASTLVMQVALLLLAWSTGRTFDDDLIGLSALQWRDGAFAFVALLTCFAVRALARLAHTEEERRRLLVYHLAPRNARESALRTATVLTASVAEELAYRGVTMSILWYALGSFWPAALVTALAFALAHWTQGLKSALAVFGIGVVLQVLVVLNETLVPAMIVHAVYDFTAIHLIGREARRREVAAVHRSEDAPTAAAESSGGSR